jgi:hypothetical protein
MKIYPFPRFSNDGCHELDSTASERSDYTSVHNRPHQGLRVDFVEDVCSGDGRHDVGVYALVSKVILTLKTLIVIMIPAIFSGSFTTSTPFSYQVP